MQATEKREFAESLAGFLEIYGRQATPAAMALWWSALDAYPLAEVRRAFSRYLQDPERGRFPPVPAVIIEILAADTTTCRLTADEAWALALDSFDEAATVCLTDEILEARNAALPVMDLGDKVGARMAFKAAYERITAARRGQPVVWQLSVGWDVARRQQAAQTALETGRLTRDQVAAYLPPPPITDTGRAIAGLLTGNVVAFPLDADAKTRKRLAELRAVIRGRSADPTARQASEQQRNADIEDAKRQALANLERLQQQGAA